MATSDIIDGMKLFIEDILTNSEELRKKNTNLLVSVKQAMCGNVDDDSGDQLVSLSLFRISDIFR